MMVTTLGETLSRESGEVTILRQHSLTWCAPAEGGKVTGWVGIFGIYQTRTLLVMLTMLLILLEKSPF